LVEAGIAAKFDSRSSTNSRHASFHKSIEIRKLVGSYGCEILYLPPYSPDLNPIEKYWGNMKKKIREILPTVSTLSAAIDSAVLSMSI